MPGASSARQRGRRNHRNDLRRFRNPLRQGCGNHQDGQRDRLGRPFCHSRLRWGTLMRHARGKFASITLLATRVGPGALGRRLVSGRRPPAALLPSQGGAATEAVDVPVVATRADLYLRTAQCAAVDAQTLLGNRRLPRQGTGRGRRFLRYSTWVERPKSPQSPRRPGLAKLLGSPFCFLATGNPTPGRERPSAKSALPAREPVRTPAVRGCPPRTPPSGADTHEDITPTPREKPSPPRMGLSVIYARFPVDVDTSSASCA